MFAYFKDPNCEKVKYISFACLKLKRKRHSFVHSLNGKS